VTAIYTIALPDVISIAAIADLAKKLDMPSIAKLVKTATLETFATDESASVQATLYKTGQNVLALCPAVSDVHYSLPNKHYIPVNLSAFKQDNGLGYDGGAEVFYPAPDPSGLIEGTITRREKGKL
jgi:urate oxidase